MSLKSLTSVLNTPTNEASIEDIQHHRKINFVKLNGHIDSKTLSPIQSKRALMHK